MSQAGSLSRGVTGCDTRIELLPAGCGIRLCSIGGMQSDREEVMRR